MIRLLLKYTVSDYENVKDPLVRKGYGVLGGVCGIVLNGILFLIKLVLGIFMQSIAVVSDAFNNLSDMASSVISLVGASLGGRHADEEHPYGHGRAEYISALLIAFLIVIFGFELLKSSLSRVVHQNTVTLTFWTGSILAFSALAKVWMWRSQLYLGRKIDSSVLMLAAKDSRNDAIATALIFVSAWASPYWAFPLDGILGLLLSCMIMFSGVKMAKELIDKLMGSQPSQELCKCIEKKVLEGEGILGMHGLMVHDYGPGRIIASAHAEVCKDLSLVQVHDVIDAIEKEIFKELGVDMVIHMDPVSPHDR